jgi:hypothetical protein
MKRSVRALRVAMFVTAALSILVPPPAVCAVPHVQASIALMSRLATAFDQAIETATSAADETITKLEARAATPPKRSSPSVDDLLDQLAGEVSLACDAATAQLDGAMRSLPKLSAPERAALLCCIDRYVSDAKCDLERAIDDRAHAATFAGLVQSEIDEHRATYQRLLDVRELVSA